MIYDGRASADSTVASGMPATNYGTETNLHLAEWSTGEVLEAFVNFDLSTLPKNALINSATFSLWQYDDGNDWQSPIIEIAAEMCAAPWTETGITWASKPANAAGTPQAVHNVQGEDTEHQWNVQAHIQKAVDGDIAWNGLRLRYTGTSSSTMKYFRSRNYATESYRPRLVIDYTPIGMQAKYSGSWRNCLVFAKSSGIWRLCKTYAKANGIWKQCK